MFSVSFMTLLLNEKELRVREEKCHFQKMAMHIWLLAEFIIISHLVDFVLGSKVEHGIVQRGGGMGGGGGLL